MYKNLSQKEGYQIYRLMKANQTLTQIAQVLGRICGTISREVIRGRGHRGYRAEQACVKATERA